MTSISYPVAPAMPVISRTEAWVGPESAPDAPAQLFCFAHAGGGPAFFGHWRRHLRGWLDVRPIHLPGRESRSREAPATAVDDVIGPVTEAVLAVVDRPFALFGHSLGAVVAFEVARELERRGRRPAALVVSARRAPERTSRRPRYQLMDREEFLKAMDALNGTPQEVMEHEELLDLMLPLLQADFVMNERYLRRPGGRLEAPILALAGENDPEVAVEELLGWRHETTASFTLRVFDGDHFYLKSDPVRVWSTLRSFLAELGVKTVHT